MTHNDDLRKLLDPVTQIDLSDVGLGGFELGESVDADGRRQFWLVDRNGLGADDTDHGEEAPVHELDGPLTADLAERILAAPFRCGRRRRDGGACRAIVTHRGDACSWHRLEQEADR